MLGEVLEIYPVTILVTAQAHVIVLCKLSNSLAYHRQSNLS